MNIFLTILKVLPVAWSVAKEIIGHIKDRPTSAIVGVSAGGLTLGLLESWGCNLTLMQESALVALTTVSPGLISNPKVFLVELLKAMKEAATDAKRPLEPPVNG